MHGVDTEIARPHPADDSVEVSAVAVEIGTRLVHRIGDFHDVALEEAAGVRVRQHDRRDIGSELRLEGLEIDAALPGRGDGIHLVAEQRGGCRVRAMRRFRHQHAGTLVVLAARDQCRADRHHAAELAMRARLGRQRDARHAGQFLQPVRKFVHQFERALHGLLRLQRMHVADARQACHLLVEARIVLHGAGSERIKARIDRIILRRQAHEMAYDFRFRHARKSDAALPFETAEPRGERLRLVEIHAASARIVEFEEKRLFKFKRLVTGEGAVRTAMRRIVDGARTALPVHA